MNAVNIPAEVEFSFGPCERKVFSQPDLNLLDSSEYSLEMLVDELKDRQYKLVEAHQYRATPALTGTVLFLFRSPDLASDNICTCDTPLILALLRGNMGESWKVQMAYMPIERDGNPTEHQVLRIHLMPISESGNSVQREQVRSCESG